MKLSIITIVLNDRENIEKTIESVLSQGVEIEYIIIDGGSIDGTLDIIEKHKDNIDIFISQKDNGIYDAMNKAVSLSSSEWICFINSGDKIYSKDTLQSIENKLSKDASTNVDVLYGDWEVIYKNKSRKVKANKKLDGIWKGMIFSHQSCFVKKDILKQYKFNETNRITADYELFYTLYKANKKFRYIPMIVASVSAGGLSDIKRVESILSRWKIIDKSFIVNIYYLKLIIAELIKIPIKKVLKVCK